MLLLLLQLMLLLLLLFLLLQLVLLLLLPAGCRPLAAGRWVASAAGRWVAAAAVLPLPRLLPPSPRLLHCDVLRWQAGRVAVRVPGVNSDVVRRSQHLSPSPWTCSCIVFS